MLPKMLLKMLIVQITNLSRVPVEHFLMFLSVRRADKLGDFVDMLRRHLFIASSNLLVMERMLLMHLLHFLSMSPMKAFQIHLMLRVSRGLFRLHSLVRLFLRKLMLFMNCF